MKRVALILLIFAFLAGCASTGQSPQPSPQPSPQVGDYAPDFRIADVSGNEIALSDFKGEKKVVLFFYANGK